MDGLLFFEFITIFVGLENEKVMPQNAGRRVVCIYSDFGADCMKEQLGEDHDLFVFSTELKWDKTDFTASEVEII